MFHIPARARQLLPTCWKHALARAPRHHQQHPSLTGRPADAIPTQTQILTAHRRAEHRSVVRVRLLLPSPLPKGVSIDAACTKTLAVACSCFNAAAQDAFGGQLESSNVSQGYPRAGCAHSLSAELQAAVPRNVKLSIFWWED